MLLQQIASQIAHADFSGTVWITTVLGLLATLTPPCPPSGSIQRVISTDGLVYARARFIDGFMLDSYSEDGGQTWQLVNQVPANVGRELEQDVSLPKIVCEPTNMQLCYRIAGQRQVEESMDGGGSWRVAWSLPEERRSYMERVAYCDKPIEVGPYDLTVINHDGIPALVVASGSEGVLVRSAAGVWERRAVEPAYGLAPTPYIAENFLAATWIMPAEICIWMFVALSTLIYLWRRSMNMMLKRMKEQLESGRSAQWVNQPIGLLVLAVISLCLLGYAMLSFRAGVFMMIDTLLEFLLAGLVVIFLLLSFVMTWQRVAHVVYQPGQAWLTAGICVLTAIAIFPLAWLPFPLWALGIISYYEFALTFSILLTILVLWWGIRRADHTSQMASTSIIGDPFA